MKQLLDFIPLVIFFICYKLYNIFTATTALIIASAISLLITYVLYKKIEKMALIAFVMILIFGSLTVAFHSDLFIKWKVTIIYLLFAFILLIGQFLFKKNAIQSMLGKELDLPASIWNKLNIAWALFFLCCAGLNIYVAFWLSENTWVNFKVFGLTCLTLLFTLFNGIYIYRYVSTVEQQKNK